MWRGSSLVKMPVPKRMCAFTQRGAGPFHYLLCFFQRNGLFHDEKRRRSTMSWGCGFPEMELRIQPTNIVGCVPSRQGAENGIFFRVFQYTTDRVWIVRGAGPVCRKMMAWRPSLLEPGHVRRCRLSGGPIWKGKATKQPEQFHTGNGRPGRPGHHSNVNMQPVSRDIPLNK
jgi:hypothetical protein